MFNKEKKQKTEDYNGTKWNPWKFSLNACEKKKKKRKKDEHVKSRPQNEDEMERKTKNHVQTST